MEAAHSSNLNEQHLTPDTCGIRVISPDEFRLFFDHVRASPCGTALELVFALGLKLNEVLTLKVSHFDTGRGFLVPPGGRLPLIVPAALAGRLAEACGGKQPEEYVFSAEGKTARPLSLRTVQKFLARTVESLNLPRITVQTIRDNFAVYSLRMGGDPALLMKQMGYRHRRSFRRILTAVPPSDRKFPSPADRLRAL